MKRTSGVLVLVAGVIAIVCMSGHQVPLHALTVERVWPSLQRRIDTFEAEHHIERHQWWMDREEHSRQ